MKPPEKLLAEIKKNKHFFIASHINPDGDAIGSALAISSALEKLGKKTFLYSRDAIPEPYSFIPGYKRIKQSPSQFLKHDPVLLLLDCNSPKRAAIENIEFRKSAVIDHHETESSYGSFRWIERHAAATGIMIFHLIKALGVKITRNMACQLYTAIAVDTGTFRFSNTSPEVLRIGAELIEAGANPYLTAEFLYDQWERKRFDLLLMSLKNIEIIDNLAIMHVTKNMFNKTGTKEEDTENFANIPRMIGSVKISVLIRELDSNAWKISMRSKGNINVAKIAEMYGGGGHRNAAGFKIKKDLKSVKEVLLKAVRDIGKTD